MFSKTITKLVLVFGLLVPLSMGAPAASTAAKPCNKRSPSAAVSPAAAAVSGYRNAAYYVNW